MILAETGSAFGAALVLACLLSHLEKIQVESVRIGGRLVARKGESLFQGKEDLRSEGRGYVLNTHISV